MFFFRFEMVCPYTFSYSLLPHRSDHQGADTFGISLRATPAPRRPYVAHPIWFARHLIVPYALLLGGRRGPSPAATRVSLLRQHQPGF